MENKEKPDSEARGGGAKRFFAGVLNTVLVILFGLTALVAAVLIFLRSIAEDLSFLPLFGWSEEAVKTFFVSIWPLLAALALLLVLLLALVFINRRSAKRVFGVLAAALFTAAAFYAVTGLFAAYVIEWLHPNIRDVIVGTAPALGKLLGLAAAALCALASLLVTAASAAACLRKGEKHE